MGKFSELDIEIRELYESGVTERQIARKLKISIKLVRESLKELYEQRRRDLT